MALNIEIDIKMVVGENEKNDRDNRWQANNRLIFIGSIKFHELARLHVFFRSATLVKLMIIIIVPVYFEISTKALR